MKVKAYVLIAAVLSLTISAVTKDAGKVEGFSPGDLAPEITSLGKKNGFHFQNHSGTYTLLSFWAAYDAGSRANNVRLSNEVSKFSSDKIVMYSVSLDEKKSVFTETVKMDKLEGTAQLHEEQGKKSALYAKYKLKRGLRSFLIDDKGVIVATDVTPETLGGLLKGI
ncbi:MAG: thioredoxin family protein [Tannerellaceae bacterium]|jgi:hypothetical protein|nr:thioredoxin family protein [Tannerellaceae bacterium]